MREAGPADLDALVAIDAEAFDGEPDSARPWIAPRLGVPGFTVALAELGGSRPPPPTRPSPTAPPGRPCCSPAWRWSRRCAAAASAPRSARGCWRAGWSGARLGHLHADTDGAARVYARLGFGEAGALAVFEDV